jgi:hypothetical protein
LQIHSAYSRQRQMLSLSPPLVMMLGDDVELLLLAQYARSAQRGLCTPNSSYTHTPGHMAFLVFGLRPSYQL